MVRRILYINSNGKFWGEGHSLVRLVNALDRTAFEPVVVCGYEGPLTERLRADGVPVHIVGMPMWRKGKSFPRIPFTLAALTGLIRRERIALVHNNSFWVNPYGVWAARFRGIPAVTHIRDTIEADKVRKYALGRAERLIAVSEGAVEAIRSDPKVRDRIDVIHNAVDLDEIDGAKNREALRALWKIRPGEIVIGELANLSPRKAQDTLLDAGQALFEAGLPIRIVLVGQANDRYRWYEAELRDRVQARGMEGFVLFAGYSKDPLSALKAFDIAVLPSTSEGFARALIEAMACGLPVVASDIPCNREALTEETEGLFFPAGDAAALAEPLRRLVLEAPLRETLGRAARRKVEERFTLAVQVERIQTLYRRILESRASAP